MKKVLYFVSALAMVLFAGSCQNETLEINADNGMVTFTVEAPGVFKATKATEAIKTTIADGRNVDQLIYEVWTIDADGDLETRLFQDNTKTLDLVDGTRQTTLALELLNDQKYAILFWAQVKGTGAYNTANLTKVSYANALNDGYFTNDEALAAFYAVAYINDGKHVAEDLVTPTNGTVKLRRPFAQLNLGTINNSADLPYNIVLDKSSLTIKGISTQFNVFDSSVSGEADVTIALKANDVPNNPATLTVQQVPYDYAAMTYLFAGDVVEVTYNIETSLSDKANPTSVVSASVNNSDNPICSVPLKENYRTNIVGNLLTTSAEYKIIVDAAWDGEIIPVTNADAAQAALDNAVAGTIVSLQPGVNYGTLYLRPSANTEVTKIVDWIGNNYRYETYSLFKNITILGAEGATVDAIEIEGGTYYNTAHSQAATYPVMLSLIELENVVIDGVTFSGKGGYDPQGYGNVINLSGNNIKVNGLTLKNCVLNNADNNARLIYKTESTTTVHQYTYENETYTFSPTLKDITVTGTSLNGGYIGLELRETENVTITDNTFNVANRNILLPVNTGCTYTGNITITGNVSNNAKERFVRMDGAGDANVVIKNNTINNYSSSDVDYIKVTGNNIDPVIENNILN